MPTDGVATAAKRFRIYTRTGDSGTSCLYTGERLPKDSAYFEALGDVDELNSALGMAREFTQDVDASVAGQLETIQSRLIDVGSAIATPANAIQGAKVGRTRFDDAHTRCVEQWIDSLDAGLPPLRHFILPSGGKAAACLHMARSICRRAERSVVALARARAEPSAPHLAAQCSLGASPAPTKPDSGAAGHQGDGDSGVKDEGSSASGGAREAAGGDVLDPAVPVYLNRLSDYLFTAARHLAAKEGRPEVTYQKAA